MLITQRPTIEEAPLTDDRSRFVVEPLEPGFGHTLGNTMRRTLLARIPGAAITSIRINGVHHEFSTIEGVVEDVVDFILNLKQVVLRIDSDDEQTLYLSASGKGDVTAGDLKAPAGVEVGNPDLRLATLSASGKLEVELTAERGVGYRSADKNQTRHDRRNSDRFHLLACTEGLVPDRDNTGRPTYGLRFSCTRCGDRRLRDAS